MNVQSALSLEEVKLLQLIKDTGYGELTIKIRNGKPVIVEKGIQTIKLEEN